MMIYSDRLFGVGITVLMVVMMVVSGSSTVAGPFIRAVATAYGQQWSRANVTEGHYMILGILIIAAMVTARHFSLLDNVRRCRL
jgi:ABC-type branched-subunit amino acid transport system permease subunit